MRHAGPLFWVAKGREKEVLKSCDIHMKKIMETVIEMDKAVQGVCNLNKKKTINGFSGTFKREREADEIKRKILEDLAKGIFHPINRDEIVRLVMTADDVASNAKAVARKLTFIDPKSLPQKLRKTLCTFSNRLVEISKTTYKNFLVLSKNPTSAVAISHQVEKLEEEIDDLRAEKLMPQLLEWYRKNRDIGSSLLLKEITDNMENVADYCEDVSDIIRCIALSRL